MGKTFDAERALRNMLDVLAHADVTYEGEFVDVTKPPPLVDGLGGRYLFGPRYSRFVALVEAAGPDPTDYSDNRSPLGVPDHGFYLHEMIDSFPFDETGVIPFHRGMPDTVFRARLGRKDPRCRRWGRLRQPRLPAESTLVALPADPTVHDAQLAYLDAALSAFHAHRTSDRQRWVSHRHAEYACVKHGTTVTVSDPENKVLSLATLDLTTTADETVNTLTSLARFFAQEMGMVLGGSTLSRSGTLTVGFDGTPAGFQVPEIEAMTSWPGRS